MLIMDRSEIKQTIIDLILPSIDSKIHHSINLYLNDPFSELGLDSLDYMEFVMALEKKFNVSISDDQMAKCNSISEFVNLIDSLINK